MKNLSMKLYFFLFCSTLFILTYNISLISKVMMQRQFNYVIISQIFGTVLTPSDTDSENFNPLYIYFSFNNAICRNVMRKQ